jgi:MFS family permease
MTSVVLGPPVRRRPRRRAAAVVGGLLLLYGAASVLGPVLAVLALVTLVAVVAWRHPGWSAVVLVALVPSNRLLILLVYHFGHSSALTSLAQLWKDLLVALLALRSLDDVILRRRPKLHYVDLLVGAFLVLSILYLVYPGDSVQIGFLDRVIGFRADS